MVKARRKGHATTTVDAVRPQPVELEPTLISASNGRQAWVWVSALVLAVGCYLIFKSLDGTYFWDDEAEVGIFARNLLHRGELTGWDGRNLFVFRDGNTTDADLLSLQPPLMFYLTAASFALFGENTWAGRLPHALCGVLSMVLLWRVLRRDLPARPLAAVYGLAAYAGCLSFILSARTCRYYAVCLAAAVAVYDFYGMCRQHDKAWMYAGLAVSAATLFFGNYLVAGVFLLALTGTHFAVRRREWTFKQHVKLTAAAALFALLVIPYSVAHQIWVRNDMYPSMAPWFIAKPMFLWLYVRDLNRINVLPFLALFGLLALCWKAPTWRRPLLTYLGLGLGYTLIMAGATPQPYRPGMPCDVRYLIGAIPFALAAVGIGLAWLHERKAWVAAVALVVLVCTNAFTVPRDFAYQFLMPRYLREIHQPYPTAEQMAVEALRVAARQDDLVMTIPDYNGIPLQFYAGDQLRICCNASNGSPLRALGVQRFAAHVFQQETFPDWIVAYGNEPNRDMMLGFMQRPHHENGVPRQYRYNMVRRLGVYGKNTQRPELPSHAFGPVTDYDQDTLDVYLFKRETVL